MKVFPVGILSVLGTFMLSITVATFAKASDNVLTLDEKKQGWILLFDGKSLNGWETSDQKPSKKPVESGCLNPHGCGAYMLVQKQTWENFVFECDFKITKDCNSGIFVRTWPLAAPPGRDVGWNGFEVQVLDS